MQGEHPMDPTPGNITIHDLHLNCPFIYLCSKTFKNIHFVSRLCNSPHLAVSAPLVIKVLISSSWPYLAATWRGVLPYLSTQSISPPERTSERVSPPRSQDVQCTSQSNVALVTVLDENLRAGEASVNGGHEIGRAHV